MFCLKGKAKHNKWAEVKNLSAADAQKKYVEAVKKLVAKYK
jgi:acyl-CoA-binding protein